jgi:hypothetical protein
MTVREHLVEAIVTNALKRCTTDTTGAHLDGQRIALQTEWGSAGQAERLQWCSTLFSLPGLQANYDEMVA